MNSSIPVAKNMRILIIDDQAPNVSLLETVLQDEGFTCVVGVCDPRRAMAVFKEFSPDLVLLDWYMPAASGEKVLREIRNMRTADYVPVMVLTADVTPNSRQKALKLGATGFLTKPFEFEEIVQNVNSMLRLRSSGIRLHWPVRPSESQQTFNAGLSFAAA